MRDSETITLSRSSRQICTPIVLSRIAVESQSDLGLGISMAFSALVSGDTEFKYR